MSETKPKAAPRPRGQMRNLLIQAAIALVLAYVVYSALVNVAINLEKQRIAGGWGFLDKTAGFAIAQSLITWDQSMTYGRAFLVGLANTLVIAAAGIVLTSILGFFVGVARLSRNPVLWRLAYWYIEVVRNVPLLFQMLFWYLAVLSVLPTPRDSLSLFEMFFLNHRGLVLPRPVLGTGFWVIPLTLLLAGLLAVWLSRRRTRPAPMAAKLALGALPLLAAALAWALVAGIHGTPLSVELATKGKFNLSGGITILPEAFALLISLVTYTAGFVAEIVRSGIQSVSKGQREAGQALGLGEWRILMLIVMPQALRVMIPPVTSQYLNLAKNSSLGAAIGYPDMVAVGGTIISQTGQAIEVILMWMACYLTISLVTSLFMNWYNKRVALIER